ncbi:hypothetical protein JCM10207_005602 [Rhodosporidiobolus poonsookiae]
MSAFDINPNKTLLAPPPTPLSSTFATLPNALLGCLVTVAVLFLFRQRRAKGPLPPGPPGLPIVGNLFDVPKSRPWVKFEEWTREYGDIFTLRLGSTTMLVVGRAGPAIELLDKRSAKYSSRARLIMTGELVSRNLRMTFMPYGDLWRRQRRLLHTLTSPQASATYEPIQEMESAQMVRDFMDRPADFWGHCQRYAGSTIMQIAFNKRAPTPQDPAITNMRKINEAMTKTAVAGRYLVDSLPVLNYIPEFLAPFKQDASRIFADTLALFSSHVNDVREKINEGDDSHCFARYILQSQQAYGLKDEEATFLAGAMYGAGSDTTADGLSTFVLTMTAYPEIQRKAQEELDRVIGRARLPSFADQPDLPYCQAVTRELLRWRTVIAGGLAHASTEDDWYNGYFIPKGTIVLANHWAIHLDPELYPDPETFNPERFLDRDPSTGTLTLKGTKYSDAGHHAYGFGRRICPGKHIADRSLFITQARLLHALSFSPVQEKPVNVNAFSEGFSSHPLAFETRIEERWKGARAIVEEACAEAGVGPAEK